MKEYQVKPEIEVFDIGMIQNAMSVAKKGLHQTSIFLPVVSGVPGGMPATPENLIFFKNSIPEGSIQDRRSKQGINYPL